MQNFAARKAIILIAQGLLPKKASVRSMLRETNTVKLIHIASLCSSIAVEPNTVQDLAVIFIDRTPGECAIRFIHSRR